MKVLAAAEIKRKHRKNMAGIWNIFCENCGKNRIFTVKTAGKTGYLRTKQRTKRDIYGEISGESGIFLTQACREVMGVGRQRVISDKQKGNLTVLQRHKKKLEEEALDVSKDCLSKPPVWLADKVAKNEYRRIVKEFESIKAVGNLDINNVAGYCNAFSFYRKATDELSGQPLTLTKETANGGFAVIENPLIKIQKQYADEMRKFGALCGLTIDSRLKIGTVNVTQEEQRINHMFGEI